MTEAISVTTTQLPTYLKSLLHEECTVKFVCRKKTINDLERQEIYEELPESSDGSELELTGTPLEVDLGGDDTVGGEVSFEKRPTSWTQAEATQYAISITEAKQYLNQHLKNSNEYMYCICDGTDDLHTVAMGCGVFHNQFVRSAVYVLPCCDYQHEMTKTEWMRKEHNVFEKTSLETEILVITYYNLFGYSLQNCSSVQNAKYNGNISLEVPQKNSNFKLVELPSRMNLSVVLGHESSSLFKFWQELCQLQSYFHLLKAGCKESTLLTTDMGLDNEEIMPLITKILTDITYKKTVNKVLDLENLRHQGVLDKLWKTLQHCRNLGDLRDSFIYFFEKLAEEETKIPEVNNQNSLVAEIASGILDGKVAVLSLTYFQSLELLIDLGLQKLRNDYITVINSFYPVPTQTVDKFWEGIVSEPIKEQSTRRKTRMTINTKCALTELTRFKHKLFCLYSMHKMSEFIFLCKENRAVEEDTFDGICQALIEEFLGKVQNVTEFKNTPHLCDFAMNISMSEELIKEALPSAWSVKLESSGLTTVFHFSENPLFPPSVYEDYDISIKDGTNFYVTKLVTITSQ